MNQWLNILAEPKAKKEFAKAKGLELLQQQLASTKTDAKIKDLIIQLNGMFTEELVKYYTPGIEKQLLTLIKASEK